jgi:hypothetical protein
MPTRPSPRLGEDADMAADSASSHPYEWRLRWRRRLPWFLINLGIADKGRDCDAVGAQHRWYNHDDASSGCYYCKVIREGRLWERTTDRDPA